MDYEKWRAVFSLAVKQARQIINDQDALEVKCLYKQWEKQLDKQLNVGEYIQYENNLYRVIQQHVAQENWKPGAGTESLFVKIDKKHSGTLEDPIPWTTNMECFVGKYYTENEQLYLCIRDSGVALHHQISNLIGTYFEKVE